jgi:hypothetical protein
LNTDFGSKDERWDCKMGTGAVLVGGGKVNRGDDSEGIWLIGLVYIHEIEQ